MTALSHSQLVERISHALWHAARLNRDVAGNVTVDELTFLAGVAALEVACLRADHPQVVPWCLACGDENCLTHCIYCWADCSVDEDDQRHQPHCPNTLHVWPACPDMLCARCGNNIGGWCTRDRGDTLVCMGCNALDEDHDNEGP